MILGFITTTIGTIVAMFILPIFGLAMILPGMLTNFFAGGTAGIFGNAVGGRILEGLHMDSLSLFCQPFWLQPLAR